MEKFLKRLENEVLLCDGAIGTLLLARGLPLTNCKEEQNILNPSLILSIHEDYIRAGAQIIETNTFAANYIQLKKFGLEKKIKQINKEAVRLAKDAAARGNVYVAGSAGPLGAMVRPYGPLTINEVHQMYAEQIGYLIEGKVDLIIIETISSLMEAKEAVKAAKQIAADIPVICQLTFMADGKTKYGDDAVESLIIAAEEGADVIGLNCSLGPQETHEVLSMIIDQLPYYISVQPNAGYPAIYQGRPVYFSDPAYLKHYAKLYIDLGANIVGCCCGTIPEHTKAMSEVVKGATPKRALPARKLPAEMKKRETITVKLKEETKPLSLQEYLKKDFVMTVEIDPPKGWDYSKLLDECKKLKELGIDLINIADNPMARVRMSSSVMAHLIKDRVGLEPILHFTCRDRNILGIQSELLGAAALGINVILALRGDPATVGDFPKATSVFDVDSLGLVKIINGLNNGFNFSGVPIDAKTHFIPGIAGNPGSKDLELDFQRLQEKVEAGAKFIQTQPVYDLEKLINFKNKIKDLNVDLIVGILPLVSYKQALYLNNEVPGISVPPFILNIFEKLSPAMAEIEGVELAREFVKEAKQYVNGFYFIPSFERFYLLERILK